MQSFVAIGDREAVVEIEAVDGHSFLVSVDGKQYRVDAPGHGQPKAGISLLVDGIQFEVYSHREKSNGGTRRFAISVNGKQVSATVTDPLAHLAQESGGAAGSAKVDAYMPGRVVAILATEGETVEKGQGVLVLEAMKMENEIAAEAAGVVSKLYVEQGQAVEGGDPLFEVTAAE